MKPFIAVFDFDHTIKAIEHGVSLRNGAKFKGPESLLPVAEQERLRDIYINDGWDAFTRASIEALNNGNLSSEDIIRTAGNTSKLVPQMDLVFEELCKDHDIIVITDSHTFKVELFLKQFALFDKVSAIFGQPAVLSDNGQIIVDKVPQEYDTCQLGGRNLCKGSAMKHFIQDKNYKQIKYFGDGKNDLCPALMLQEQDIVFPRLNYKLVELLTSGQHQPKAQIRPWHCGSDILSQI